MATAGHRSAGYGKLTFACHRVTFNAQKFKYVHSQVTQAYTLNEYMP